MSAINFKPSQVLLAILALISQSGKFSANHKKLHEIFYNLKQKPEYEIFLQEFLFNSCGHYPVSNILDEKIESFGLAGILGISNPTYKEYKINVSTSALDRTFYSSLNHEDQINFKVMTEEFLRKIAE